MFGVIEIDHDINSRLVEKAGREGLIENIAYQEFKNILINFFIQLAKDFFRENSVNDRFSVIKNELKEVAIAQKELIAKRKKQVSYKKEQFKKEIDEFFERLSNGFYVSEVEAIKSFVYSELKKSSDSWDDKKKYHFISDIRANVSQKWKNIDRFIKVTKPNVGLSNTATKEWESYLKNKIKLSEDVIEPAKREIDTLIAEYISKHGLTFSVRERVNELVEEEKKIPQ